MVEDTVVRSLTVVNHEKPAQVFASHLILHVPCLKENTGRFYQSDLAKKADKAD